MLPQGEPRWRRRKEARPQEIVAAALEVFAEKGSLTVRDLWDNRSVVHVEETSAPRPLLGRILTRAEAKLGRALPWKPAPGRKLTYPAQPASKALPGYPSQIDFMRGVADQAEAIGRREAPRFSGALALHITELALAPTPLVPSFNRTDHL